MKKILLITLLAAVSFTSFGQANVYPGYPLYGTAPNVDRTYRDLQLGTTTISDTLGSTIDTIRLIPGFVSGAGAVFHKDYVLNLQDSCVLAISNVQNSFEFSTMTIYISAPALAGRVRFLGYGGLVTQWALTAANTSISPTANHWFVINFVQIGNVWAEVCQSQD